MHFAQARAGTIFASLRDVRVCVCARVCVRSCIRQYGLAESRAQLDGLCGACDSGAASVNTFLVARIHVWRLLCFLKHAPKQARTSAVVLLAHEPR